MDNPEFLYWFVIPTVLAALIALGSIIISLKRRSVGNWIGTLIIMVLISLSEIILYQIFFEESYPSYIPHVLIGFSLILFLIQILRKSRKVPVVESTDVHPI